MEKWFAQQSYLTQMILVIIPIIGWVIEILVRVFALIRKKSKTNIIGLIVFVLFGGFWILCFIDVFVLYYKEDLMILD